MYLDPPLVPIKKGVLPHNWKYLYHFFRVLGGSRCVNIYVDDQKLILWDISCVLNQQTWGLKGGFIDI
jgi:hypothetical protein